MLSRMSTSASRARLESINGVTFGAGPHERLQAFAICHVHRPLEHVAEVLLDADVLKQTDRCFWLKLNQDVDIAVGFFFPTRDRAEQGRMQHSTMAEFPLVSAQRGDDLFLVHATVYIRNLADKLGGSSPRGRTRALLHG